MDERLDLDRREGLSLICAETPSELAAIGRFRQATFAHRSAIDLDPIEAADHRAHVFAIQEAGRILACARVLPLPDDDAGIRRFDHPAALGHGMQTEVGRLAAAADGAPRLALSMLALGSYWMVEHTRHRDYVAYCSPRLASLYRRVGARDLGVEVARPGSERPYRFVVGRFDETAERLLGWLGHTAPDDLVRPPSRLAGVA